MALDSYANLQLEIADWLNRQDLAAKIPTFIVIAEAQMGRVLRTQDMEVRATASLSSQFLALPDDFLSMKQFQLNTDPVSPLEYVPAHQLDQIRKDVGGVAQKPRNFSQLAGEIEVAPVPDQTYEAEMVYYAKIPALSDTNTSNWVLVKHPDLYLYSALLAAAPYLHEDERVPAWKAQVAEVLEQIRVADERYRAGAQPLRARTRQAY